MIRISGAEESRNSESCAKASEAGARADEEASLMSLRKVCMESDSTETQVYAHCQDLHVMEDV